MVHLEIKGAQISVREPEKDTARRQILSEAGLISDKTWAQEEGLDAIPVAINRRGNGTPTEIEGMNGTVLPNDFRAAAKVSRETQPDRSIFGRMMDAIVPRAEAARAPAARKRPVAWQPPSLTATWLLSDVFADHSVPIKAGCGWLPNEWVNESGLHHALRSISRRW